MEYTSDQKIFNSFYEACVHRGKIYMTQKEFTSLTHAIVKYTVKNSGPPKTKTFQKSSVEKHAEENIISKLTDILEKKRKLQTGQKLVLEVKVYISFSPCSECSMKLIKFKQEQHKKDTEVRMEIVFANLYRINRPSCTGNEKCASHMKFYAENTTTSAANVEGLTKMKTNRIDFRTFCPEDWAFLRSFLGVQEPVREQEDRRMAEDLKALVRRIAAPPRDDDDEVEEVRKQLQGI